MDAMVIGFKRNNIIAEDDFQEITLKTDRLYLRAPRKRDEEDWLKIRETSRTFLEPWEPSWPNRPLKRRDFKAFYKGRRKKWQLDTGYSFFLLSQEGDDLIGGVNVNNVVRGVAQFASLGYWIGAPYHNQGYMSEALARITAYCFDDLALHKITASCIPENKPSQTVLKNLGFTYEGMARRHLKIAGQWRDHKTYGLLDSDPRLDAY